MAAAKKPAPYMKNCGSILENGNVVIIAALTFGIKPAVNAVPIFSFLCSTRKRGILDNDFLSRPTYQRF